ncbi:Breast carcinoma-amplified sequence 3 homolog [Eumeta japonica]|uniref:Breast carcinoma-amplified sequence 3 homolog n=1 Tax=Eumeta variegata TaxID=151549 RepID=A0A4C1WB57_EUMVA|nr:Breast carcinoma-amplified sequence 3 homolog [Eumeta japonica]
MSAESPRHARSGGPLTVPSQPPSDRSLIDAVSGFINDVTLSSASAPDPKDTIQWARFETADINEPTPEGENETELSPLLLILGYGSGVQVWVIPPNGEAQEVLSWRQGSVRVLRILPTPQYGDSFVAKRPLIALCDSAGPGPTFCSLSFISVRGGEQAIVVSFSERFAVFDAGTLEDRLAITTCYPCPCPLGGSSPINALALGDRWLAYADKKINPSKRSSGGCEGEGVSSYTATVLHAAKSLSKGLRGLGESVAHSLAGGRGSSQSPSPPNTDLQQPGVVTILDIEANSDDDMQDGEETYDPTVAHFVAHSDAIIAMKFDASGMLLVTADRRGHDFHVFRINPHPCGPSLASVHHLYILHRGDTTAKVQDIAISADSRWTAVSTLRGTTHVFPVSPYGGACGVRTHTQPRVVNRLSRFHRSAGLPIHSPARCGSPVSELMSQGTWYPNPRLPPYPLPITATPLAQLRPTAAIPTHTITRNSSGRQRLSSLSEDSNSLPLLARARFGPCTQVGPRAPAAHSLYLMAANGCLLHYLLHPKAACTIPKEKVSDDSPIELEVEAVAQWPLQRPLAAADLLAPLPPTNPLLQPLSCRRYMDACASASEEERWCAQVEIVTHAGPHRRLWMGPQFVFKTYNLSGSTSSLSEAEAVEVGSSVARSTPVNMPGRPLPLLVDEGSASSLEHSPCEGYRRKSLAEGRTASVCDVQLREDLAEAMKEDQARSNEVAFGLSGIGSARGGDADTAGRAAVVRAVDPLGTVVVPPAGPELEPELDDPDDYTHSNSDETTFRPVVRAPAALPPQPHIVARPLPHNTTIPVLRAAAPAPRPEPESRPLASHVVIPAALTTLDSGSEPDDVRPRALLKESDINLDHKLNDKSIFLNKDLKYDRPEMLDCMNVDGSESNLATTARVDMCEVDLKSLPISNRAPSDDIHTGGAKLRIKKSPTPKSVSDKLDSKIINVKGSKGDVKINKEETSIENTGKQFSQDKEKKLIPEKDKNILVHDIKIEEQAWDMLINEPSQSIPIKNTCQIGDKNCEELKTKPKKHRKNKLKQSLEETNMPKTEDDSFVEIHTIEHKQARPTDELVSISDDCSNNDSFNDLLKSKSSHSSKSCTSFMKFNDSPHFHSNDINCTTDDALTIFSLEMNNVTKDNTPSGVIDAGDEAETNFTETIKSNETDLDTIGIPKSEHVRTKRTNQMPSFIENNRPVDKYHVDTDKTNVIIIDSTADDFPEIQITRGSKIRKKSPQSLERTSQGKEVLFEKPQKSWSSVAALKNVKKPLESKETKDKTAVIEVENKPCSTVNVEKSEISLHDKLVELCKKTDIVIAECDVPTELNFVEEHHTLCDLPPLEPLDFALDDFKLEMMRDSILDVNDANFSSPICKINIDDILTSIKETTNKTLESSAYNLVAFERVPMTTNERREKEFSVVESESITAHEVDIKLDGDEAGQSSVAKISEMEKSSDDDNASPVSSQTDSDKDDKKTSGAVSVAPPSKQAAKKKSRKKKNCLKAEHCFSNAAATGALTCPSGDARLSSGARYEPEPEPEELSSSSFSSASRASLDPPASPTPSGDHVMHFPGDSGGSV